MRRRRQPLIRVVGREEGERLTLLRERMLHEQDVWEFGSWILAPPQDLILWLEERGEDGDEDDERQAEILAYMVIDERHAIHLFETKYHGVGYGTEIIQALHTYYPDLWLDSDPPDEGGWGEAFWNRLGLL